MISEKDIKEVNDLVEKLAICDEGKKGVRELLTVFSEKLGQKIDLSKKEITEVSAGDVFSIDNASYVVIISDFYNNRFQFVGRDNSFQAYSNPNYNKKELLEHLNKSFYKKVGKMKFEIEYYAQKS